MNINQELKPNYKAEFGSSKNFGFVFSIVFLLIFAYTIFQQNIIFTFLLLSILFSLFSIFYPKIFHYPNIWWSKLGIIIGFFISPIIMLLIYFLIFFPTGIIFQILRKDLLCRKINKNSKSYWKYRKESIQSLRNQF